MDSISIYTKFLENEEGLFGSICNPKKSTPSTTPIPNRKLNWNYNTDNIRFKTNPELFKFNSEDQLYSSSNKRKRDINYKRPNSVGLEKMNSRKSPKYISKSSPNSRNNLKLIFDENEFNETEFNPPHDYLEFKKPIIFNFDKYDRGLDNIDNLKNKKWLAKNSTGLKYISDFKLSEQIRYEMIDLITDHIIKDSFYDYKIHLKNYMINNYDIFDLLHFKIRKCKKEGICKSKNTQCLCRYYHDSNPEEDDINSLIYIMFYNTFKKQSCTKSSCNNKICCYFHNDKDPSKDKIIKKIIDLLIYIYDKYNSENKYTNLIRLIKDELMHIEKNKRLYILENIGYERSKYFEVEGLNVKSPSKITEEYLIKIKQPLAQRLRTDSGSAPTSPVRKDLKNKSNSRLLRKPRSISFDKYQKKYPNSQWKKFNSEMSRKEIEFAKNFIGEPLNATELAEKTIMIAPNNKATENHENDIVEEDIKEVKSDVDFHNKYYKKKDKINDNLKNDYYYEDIIKKNNDDEEIIPLDNTYHLLIKRTYTDDTILDPSISDRNLLDNTIF